jgi:hypothetical protein
MRFKKVSSALAGLASPSASGAKDKHAEKEKNFHTTATQTLQNLYKLLVQKLDLTKMNSTMKRNLKIAGSSWWACWQS